MYQNRYKKLGQVMFCLFLICSLTGGCEKTVDSEEIKENFTIGVVTKSKDSEYWMRVCSGMEKAAKNLGVSVIIESPDKETDDKMQKKMIDDFLERKVDALAVSPIQSYGAGEYLKKAEELGIPVYSYDTRIENPGIPYIGIDNEKIGYELAECLSEQMNGRGSIGIICGDLNQSVHADRLYGFKQYIKNNTDIDIAFVESGYSNRKMSEKEISRLFETYQGVGGIFATSAVTALGIMDYRCNQPIKIVTVDAQQDALEAVYNGGIKALAAQSGYDIGYQTIQYIVDTKSGEELPLLQILDTEIVTSQNVNQYKEK